MARQTTRKVGNRQQGEARGDEGRLEAARIYTVARVVSGWLEGQARGNRDRQGATRAG